MYIGVPKEIKPNEYRVAMTPAGVLEMIRRGHQVYVQHQAGTGSGYSDAAYEEAGAKLCDAATVYRNADMIYKIKEILPAEFSFMREDLVVFTYLHSNAYPDMTRALLERKIIGIAYEDVVDEEGQFPLLRPMSELAGKGGFIAGLNLMQSVNGGQGLLLARTAGVKIPHISIIGAGAAGLGAAELALGFGNGVSILDIDLCKLESLKRQLPAHAELLYSNRENVLACLERTDLLINCILWDKTRKDHLIYRGDLKRMKPGGIIVDVSCDEAGAIETSHATSHDDPTYIVDGIVHYAVDNIPSAFSKTATEMLANVTLPYALLIADRGVREALTAHAGLRRGLSFYRGLMTLEETARKLGYDFVEPLKAFEK